ncbi:MAG TPA: hypothetical protein HPQ03_14745 [Deltaproteobacteria bacterium]|nr:hypothetical protein [Deltaproteobacteria bacterium]
MFFNADSSMGEQATIGRFMPAATRIALEMAEQKARDDLQRYVSRF